MFLEYISKLGLNSLDAGLLADAYNSGVGKGLSDCEAGGEAVEAFHKTLHADLNEVRKLADVQIVKYPVKRQPFDYNGMTLSREPTEIEKQIDLKGMVAAYDDEKTRISRILMSMRKNLIKQSTDAVSKLGASDIYTLTLNAPSGAAAKLRAELERAVQTGRDQVIADLAAQKKCFIVGIGNEENA